MLSLTPTHLFLLLPLLAITHAFPNLLFPRQAPSKPANLNLTNPTCFPVSHPPLPPLPPANCLAAFQNFTSQHAHTGKRPHITFTTNITKTRLPAFSEQYVATPIEIAPLNEPVVGGGECGVAFAVYYGAAPAGQEQDVSVKLRVLRKVVEYVVGTCAGKEGQGEGGSAVLTTREGGVIDVTVQRPV